MVSISQKCEQFCDTYFVKIEIIALFHLAGSVWHVGFLLSLPNSNGDLISMCLGLGEAKTKPLYQWKSRFFLLPHEINGENFTQVNEVDIKFPWGAFLQWPCCAFLLTVLVLKVPAAQRWAVVSPSTSTCFMKTSCKLSRSDLMFVDSSRVGSELQRNSKPNPLFQYLVQNKL